MNKVAQLLSPSLCVSVVCVPLLLVFYLFRMILILMHRFYVCVCLQVQSVIQPNTSVIQSTPSLQSSSLPKGNIILVSKPNSVIHTAGGGGCGSIQAIQVLTI